MVENSSFIYSKTISLRVFMQRFNLRRFVANKSAKPNESKGSMQRTIMADSLDMDLKDNTGRFNCGKPSGWIEDFHALPSEMQQLIREIKRVRAVFGVVTMENPTDDKGQPIDEVVTPFIWEIDNNQAFKLVGEQMGAIVRRDRLPIEHAIKFSPSLEHQMDNNSSYFTPVCKADMSVVYNVTKEDDAILEEFTDWVKNNNDMICKDWDTNNTKRQEEMPEEQKQMVEEFIDIDMEGEDSIMNHPAELALHRYMTSAANNKSTMSEEVVQQIGNDIMAALRRQFGKKEPRKFRLRMSNVGRPTCQLWFEKNKPEEAQPKSTNFVMNMMLGDIVEAVFKGLLKEAGVEYEDTETVNLDCGDTTVNGSYDIVINDAVDDIKSASDWSYRNKFDSYGYPCQR